MNCWIMHKKKTSDGIFQTDESCTDLETDWKTKRYLLRNTIMCDLKKHLRDDSTLISSIQLVFTAGLFYDLYWFHPAYSLCMLFFLFRILTSSALLLCRIFHRLADSPRGPWWETVSDQIRSSVGHLLPTCPLQDLPLYILKRKADEWNGNQNCPSVSCKSTQTWQ